MLKFFKNLKRSLCWFIFTWNDKHIIEVIDRKLEEMEKSCSSNHIATCRYYLNKMQDDTLCRSILEKYYNKYEKTEKMILEKTYAQRLLFAKITGLNRFYQKKLENKFFVILKQIVGARNNE